MMHHMKRASVRDLRYNFPAVERMLRQGRDYRNHQTQARHREADPGCRGNQASTPRLHGTVGAHLRQPGSQTERCRDDRPRTRPLLSAYADSSFLVSLYVADSNSSAVISEMARLALPVMVTSLGELELENAIQLRIFRKQIAALKMRRARAAFRADVEAGVLAIKPMSEAMYTEARRLSARWISRLGTRTLDILHVASAMVLEADSFHTFDDRQKKLAKSAGLVCG